MDDSPPPAGQTFMNSPKWIVTQIEARERYAVPRAFHARGHLDHFFTDVWWTGKSKWTKRLPGGEALTHRFHPDLPPERVTGFNRFGIYHAALRMFRGKPKSAAQLYTEFVRIGEGFARRVNRALDRLHLDPASSAAFLFSTGALETCQYLKEQKIPIIVDQLDPARLDEQMVQAEIERWPGWEEFPGKVPEIYYSRLEGEWRLADRVIVNSNWSRSALLQNGVSAEKIAVVPLCYEQGSNAPTAAARDSSKRPLKVLWLGQIVLRKGIPYLFEAAAKLKETDIQFIVAGRMGISETGLAAAPANVKVLGRVTHDEAVNLYAQSDVFVLPTVSDGFALTQLEAMSFGLPVITTPNCGDVVTNGSDGFIIPPRDSDALADAILRIDRDRELLHEMSVRALETVNHPRFKLDGYADAVENVLAGLR
jgi:glycosyltransferase involved in cell wall biosynthesis